MRYTSNKSCCFVFIDLIREYLDQGLTRPKVLILVPFRKHACTIVKIIISLLMRKNEEYITNKKRFFDEFSSDGYNDKNDDEKEKQSYKGGNGKKIDASSNSIIE
jgi:hypothetical protein